MEEQAIELPQLPEPAFDREVTYSGIAVNKVVTELYFDADQMQGYARAAVLAERSRALAEVEKVKKWLSGKDTVYAFWAEDEVDDCLDAIRKGTK